MKQLGQWVYFVVPTLAAFLALGAQNQQVRANAEDLKQMVPRTEFNLVIQRLDRLEGKIDHMDDLLERQVK